MKLTHLFVILISFGFHSDRSRVENNGYPTLLWSFNIYDTETKKQIKGVTCIREVYYEYLLCQPEMSLMDKIEWIPKLLLQLEESDSIQIKRPDLNKEELLKELEEAKTELEKFTKWNLIPIRDTISINTIEILVAEKPTKKYEVKLIHPDYRTLTIKDSFDICKMSIHINIGMNKK